MMGGWLAAVRGVGGAPNGCPLPAGREGAGRVVVDGEAHQELHVHQVVGEVLQAPQRSAEEGYTGHELRESEREASTTHIQRRDYILDMRGSHRAVEDTDTGRYREAGMDTDIVQDCRGLEAEEVAPLCDGRMGTRVWDLARHSEALGWERQSEELETGRQNVESEMEMVEE